MPIDDAALRLALKPFAEVYQQMLETQARMREVDKSSSSWPMPDDELVDTDMWDEARMTFGEFRRAAEALKIGG